VVYSNVFRWKTHDWDYDNRQSYMASAYSLRAVTKKLPVKLRSVWVPSDILEYVIIWPPSVSMDARLQEFYYSYFP